MEYIKYIIAGLIVLFLISRLLPVKGVNNSMSSKIKTKLKNRKI